MKRKHQPNHPVAEEEKTEQSAGDDVLVKNLQEMASWVEGGAGAQGVRGGRGGEQVVWYDQTWSHLLHSFFILLNSFFGLLSFETRARTQHPPASPPALTELEDPEASQLSQLSQRSEVSIASTASGKGGKGGKKKKEKKLRKKRKRDQGEVGEDGTFGERRKVEEATTAARMRLLSEILNAAQEFKAFCRKNRVGSLYEVNHLSHLRTLFRYDLLSLLLD
jgi:hypothetical protein